MDAGHITQLSIIGLESALIAVVLLGAHALRRWFGLAMLLMLVGSFQFLQSTLALAIYVEIAPGVIVSPGSAVLFSANLFAVLLVYVRDGTETARGVIYGIVGANVLLTLMVAGFGWQINDPDTKFFVDIPVEIFTLNIRLFMVGTLAVFLDALLVVVTWETLSRVLRRPIALRVFATLSLVLAFDTIFFATGGFVEKPEYVAVLVSGLLGKSIAAFCFSVVLAIWLAIAGPDDAWQSDQDIGVVDLFAILTIGRQSTLPSHVIRDAETGLYNGPFLDEALSREVARASFYGGNCSLVVVEPVAMTEYLKEHGAETRTRLLMALVATIEEASLIGAVRARVAPKRFAVILPDRGEVFAKETATALQNGFVRACHAAEPEIPVASLRFATLTFPGPGESTEEILEAVQAQITA